MSGECGRIRRPQRLAAAIACLCLAGGCVQGPDYQKPAVEVPSAYRFDGPPVAPDNSIAGQAWWIAFGDPNLDTLVGEPPLEGPDRVFPARRNGE